MGTPYYARSRERNHYVRGLSVYTVVSFALHVAVFVLILVSAAFFTADSDAVPFGSPVITVRAVDPSTLARNKEEAAPAFPPETETKPEPPPDLTEPAPPPASPEEPEVDTGATVVLPDEKAKAEEEKKKKEEEKKTLAEKKKEAEERKKKKEAEDNKRREAKDKKAFNEIRKQKREEYMKQQLAGGIIDGGGDKPVGYGSPTGTGAPGGDVTACAIEMDMYFAHARDRVWDNWVFPERPENLSVSLYVEIARDGQIVDARIDRSSGNGLFDKAAIDTLYKINPLDPPPKCNQEETIKRRWKLKAEETG